MSFLGSELGKGGEDGGIVVEGLKVDGVLDHLLGDGRDLDEGVGSAEDTGKDI